MNLTTPFRAGGQLLRFNGQLSGPRHAFDISRNPPPANPPVDQPDDEIQGSPVPDPARFPAVPGCYALFGPGKQPTAPPVWNGATPNVIITPQDDPQQVLNKAGRGAVVGIAPGIHDRWVSVHPHPNQTLLAFAGATLRGSMALTDWQRRDGLYRHADIAAWNRGALPNWVTKTYSFSKNSFRAEVLYFYLPDGRIIYGNHVNSKRRIAKDFDFWIDYDSGHIWTYSIEIAKALRISRKADAIQIPSGVSGVTIKGYSAGWMLDVREYGNQWHRGAVHASGNNADGVYQHILCRLNHGVGINANGHRSLVLECDVIENGQLGLLANGGDHVKIIRNRMIRNNPRERVGIAGWETGGIKFSRGANAEVAYNYGTGNSHNFLWADVNPVNFDCHHNFGEFNDGKAGFHEWTRGGTWRQNFFRQNCQNFMNKNGDQHAFSGMPAEFMIWEAAAPGSRVLFSQNVIELGAFPNHMGPACVSIYESDRSRQSGYADIHNNRFVFMDRYGGKTKPRTGTFSHNKRTPQNNIDTMNRTVSFVDNRYHVLDEDAAYFWETYAPLKHRMRTFDAVKARGWEKGSRCVSHASSKDLPIIDRTRLRLDARGCPLWTDLFQEATLA